MPDKRALVVEDEPWVREEIAAALRSAGDLQVVACASKGEARACLLQEPFDVAVIDCQLPDGSGVDLVPEVVASAGRPVVLMLTVLEDRDTVLRSLRAGAHGFLVKSASADALVEAVRELLRGATPIDARIARHLVDAIRTPSREPPTLSDAEMGLTPREREVLALLARGLSYREVANLLGLGVGTVQTYVKRIYEALDVSSKAEATAVAVRMGLA